MSQLKVNSIVDASGGSNAVLYGPASPAGSMGFRNRIINGDMRIDQRNAGAAVTADGSFVVDRWVFQQSQTKLSLARSTTAPSGFTNSVAVTVTSAYTPTADDYFLLTQNIEGFNVADLGFGSASAKTITVSFWVRSSVTGTYSVGVANSAYNRSYVTTYTISAANTWEQKSVTISGDTTGTWLTDNGIGLRVRFNLGSGPDRDATANTWGTGADWGVSGDVDLVANTGATFYITGVQLEVGSVATEFERRPYGTELALCQRYYQTVAKGIFGIGYGTGSYAVTFSYPLKASMRTTPSFSLSANTLRLGDMVAQAITITSATIANNGYSDETVANFNFLGTFSAAPTSYRTYLFEPSGGNGVVQMSAEL